MAEKEEVNKDEIPAFKISDKRVDDSWKEEVRREREAAAARAEKAPKPAPAPSPAEPTEGGKPPAESAAPRAEKAPSGSAVEQAQTKMFMTFLAGLAQQSLMQLGEMENPYTGQRELDLQGARQTIELLATLQAKTKGNLSSDEEQSLNETIKDLKMRFVEITTELQRQAAMKAKGGLRPGPGGTVPGKAPR